MTTHAAYPIWWKQHISCYSWYSIIQYPFLLMEKNSFLLAEWIIICCCWCLRVLSHLWWCLHLQMDVFFPGVPGWVPTLASTVANKCISGEAAAPSYSWWVGDVNHQMSTIKMWVCLKIGFYSHLIAILMIIPIIPEYINQLYSQW